MWLPFCVVGSRQLLFTADTDISTHTDGIFFSASVSPLCCLAQSVTGLLNSTLLQNPPFLCNLCRCERLLPVATEPYLRKFTCRPVLFAYKTLLAMTSWARQAFTLFAVLSRARAYPIVTSSLPRRTTSHSIPSEECTATPRTAVVRSLL